MQVLKVLRGPEGPGSTRQVKPYVSEQSLHCAL